MAEQLPVMTDPAREMADLLSDLRTGNMNMTGDQYLAEKFQVEPWDQDYYRIIATIMDRLHVLRGIIFKLPMDDDYRIEMVGHVNEIEHAFTPNAFQNNWQGTANGYLGPANIQPIKGLSGMVRQQISYRKLSADELEELTGQVRDLTKWLNEHQLAEHDFIRQALLEGLEHLAFRLERFRWLGWGYTLESLREVIAAYMLLERKGVDQNISPDAAAMLSKVGTVIKAVYSKLEKAKDVYETGDWLLRAYGAASLAYTTAPTISGLLPG